MDLSTDISTSGDVGRHEIFRKIGQLTRQLHDALTELGYTDTLHGTVGQIPDARTRLAYIARLTGEAAEKVLNRVDMAKAEHDHILTQTRRIGALVVQDPVAAVAKGEVMNFVTEVETSVGKIDQHLTEIMLAQDFHDLTGQVISKVVRLAETMEKQLVEILVQSAPMQEPGVALVTGAAVAEVAAAPGAEALNGPVVNPEGRTDVVSDQSQVDELLASLGF